jgi:DNA-directed RNA polymerase subunit L
MDPKISNLEEKNGLLSMTVSGLQHTLLNSIRRVIVADIPTFVFRTFPHAENKVRISVNTTRHNNEILKQRLGCIPIHISDVDFPYGDYQIEVDKKNNTDIMQYLTTEDFKIFNKNTKQYLTDASVHKFFPASPITGDYILIARLMPKLSENLVGEHIKFEADISVSTAKQDGMYNVSSTCSFGCTVDPVKANSAWMERKKELVAGKMKKDELEFEEKNWRLLEAKRHVVENSHEFLLESVGVYENMRIMDLACGLLIEKFKTFIENVKTNNNIIIEPNRESTVPNEFIIKMLDEDYTLGNPLVYYMYQKHFVDDKSITFVGFRKPHPHNNLGEIRLAFSEPTDASTVALYLTQSATKCAELYKNVQDNFSKL